MFFQKAVKFQVFQIQKGHDWTLFWYFKDVIFSSRNQEVQRQEMGWTF